MSRGWQLRNRRSVDSNHRRATGRDAEVDGGVTSAEAMLRTPYSSALFRGRRKAENPILRESGGEGGIRTPDTVTRMPQFECGAFNHSATSPEPDARRRTARPI